MRQFSELGSASPVSVVFDVPSKLPALLEAGQVDAILVSSIEALRQPCRAVGGVSISSQRAVRSVRVFSDVPFSDLDALTPDPSSLTSNALARIVLDELYDVRPAMTEDAPAQVLIGDAGMRRESAAYVLDLGSAWFELTGLPFVWAVWLGRQDMAGELADHLRAASAWGQNNLDSFLSEAAVEAGFEVPTAEAYFTKVMDYDLDANHLRGLEEFRKHLLARRWIPESSAMELI